MKIEYAKSAPRINLRINKRRINNVINKNPNRNRSRLLERNRNTIIKTKNNQVRRDVRPNYRKIRIINK